MQNGSYEVDDRENLEGFLDYIIQKEPDFPPATPIPEVNPFSPTDVNTVVLDYSDLNIVYNISGYICNSICKISSTCSVCRDDVFADVPVQKNGKFVSLKEYKTGSLSYASQKVFEMFAFMEKVLIILKQQLIGGHENAMKSFAAAVRSINHNVQNCHGMEDMIITRFVKFRLSISAIRRER